MEGYKAGWKVVLPIPPSSRPGWTYSSCSVYSSARNYRVGEATQPRMGAGPLCVFADAESAIAFMKMNETFWYIRGGGRRVLFPCWYKASGKNIIWSNGWANNDPGTLCLAELPEGTVLAEEVVLCGEPFYKAEDNGHQPSTSSLSTFSHSNSVGATVGM